MRDRTFPPSVLRWSELKQMARSPAHFRAAYLYPRAPTAPMRGGSIVHFLLFGNNDMLVYEGERRGNAWSSFKEANPKREIVTRSEVEDAEPVAAAVRENPIVLEHGLLRGAKESELEWEGQLGRKCAGRLDVVKATGDIVELKTCTNSSPEKFAWQSAKMLYHAQCAWYRMGARAHGFAAETTWVISVEVDPPYEVTVFRVAARALEEGEKFCRLLVERVDACQKEGAWPGYVQVPVPLDIPDDGGTLIVGGEAMDL